MIIYEGITCQLKFLKKMAEKSLANFFLINLQEQSHVIWEFLVVKIVIFKPTKTCIYKYWILHILKIYIIWNINWNKQNINVRCNKILQIKLI